MYISHHIPSTMTDDTADILEMKKCHLASLVNVLSSREEDSRMDDDRLRQAASKLPVSTTHRHAISVSVEGTPGTESINPSNRVRGFPTGPLMQDSPLSTYPSHEGPPEMLQHKNITTFRND